METEKKFGKKGELKMNLKDHLENLTDEEISEMLEDLTNLQKERLKEKEERYYYEFRGTWVWGTWAKNQEEAEKLFNEAYLEDFEISDGCEVKKYE